MFRFATLEAALTFAGRFGSDLMRVEAAGPAGRRDHRPRVTEVNYAASAHNLAEMLPGVVLCPRCVPNSNILSLCVPETKRFLYFRYLCGEPAGDATTA